MKKYAVILITVLLLAPFMAKMLFTTAFYFNQSRIASELCVQRNVANNSCKGTCYLKKKLDNLEHSEHTKSSKPEKSSEEKVYFTGAASVFVDAQPHFIALVFYDSYSHNSECAHLSDIFHPPSI